MFYRGTSINSGSSPSELFNSRQVRTKLDALLPSPVYIAQSKLKNSVDTERRKAKHQYKSEILAMRCTLGSHRSHENIRTRTFNVRVVPNGPIWRRHLNYPQYRYATDNEQDPGNVPSFQNASPEVANETTCEEKGASSPLQLETVPSPERPYPEKYTCQNPRYLPENHRTIMFLNLSSFLHN